MRKIISLILVLLLISSLIACSQPDSSKTSKNKIKIGMILPGDTSEAFSNSHIEGIKTAAAEVGFPEENIMYKYDTPEGQPCYDACVDLVEKKCQLIITVGYEYQEYTKKVAEKFHEVQFIAIAGNTAKLNNLPNFKNAFTKIFESRYITGIVAGLKLKELEENGNLTDKNYDSDKHIKIGYVASLPLSEIISGYSSFYLGVKSVYKNVVMNVKYTKSWSNEDLEKELADNLLDDGCVILGYHADSLSVPKTVQEAYENGKTCFCVGCNTDLQTVAKDAGLTTAISNWNVYYQYLIDSVLNDKDIAVDWARGYDENAVTITPLSNSCAKGTQIKIDEAINLIKTNKLHVFDTKNFTVNQKEVTSAMSTDTTGDNKPDSNEAIFDGYYHESDIDVNQSSPSFSLIIDGITEN